MFTPRATRQPSPSIDRERQSGIASTSEARTQVRISPLAKPDPALGQKSIWRLPAVHMGEGAFQMGIGMDIE